MLLDGNLGIGGDPVLLLRRVRELLAPDAEILPANLKVSGPETWVDASRRTR